MTGTATNGRGFSGRRWIWRRPAPASVSAVNAVSGRFEWHFWLSSSRQSDSRSCTRYSCLRTTQRIPWKTSVCLTHFCCAHCFVALKALLFFCRWWKSYQFWLRFCRSVKLKDFLLGSTTAASQRSSSVLCRGVVNVTRRGEHHQGILPE